MIPLLIIIVVLIAAVIVLARRSSGFTEYRSTHTHTAEDFEAARRKSLLASKRTVSGKVQEHIYPLLPEFAARFNLRDARFLGSPIDFVVFDGLDDDQAEITVHLIEVKTGKSSLNARERRIKQAVEAGRVEFSLVRLDGYTETDEIAGPVVELESHKFDDERGNFVPDV